MGISEILIEEALKKKSSSGTSLAVQWLRLHASTAGGAGSIPGWGTKILHAVRRGQKKKEKKSSAQDGHPGTPRSLPVLSTCRALMEMSKEAGTHLPSRVVICWQAQCDMTQDEMCFSYLCI